MPTYLPPARQRLWLSEQAVMITASSRGCNRPFGSIRFWLLRDIAI
jgi:hypothetical protein